MIPNKPWAWFHEQPIPKVETWYLARSQPQLYCFWDLLSRIYEISSVKVFEQSIYRQSIKGRLRKGQYVLFEKKSIGVTQQSMIFSIGTSLFHNEVHSLFHNVILNMVYVFFNTSTEFNMRRPKVWCVRSEDQVWDSKLDI